MHHIAFLIPAGMALAQRLEEALSSGTGVAAIVDGLLSEAGDIEYVVHIYYGHSDDGAALLEAKYNGLPLGGKYSARKDPAHAPSGQFHLHLFARGKELGAINRDGTGHDGSTGVTLPPRVVAGMQKHFPQFRIPPSHVIESAPSSIQRLVTDLLERQLLLEGGA